MEKTNYPLIIVFYLDKDLMTNANIIQPFAESVNQMIESRNANALAFFLPTSGEERVEVLNPVQIAEPEMEKINKIVEDIKKSFSIGIEMNIPDEEIVLESKPCDCGNNPEGNCKCD
jgi:hypothetical protein